MTIPDKPNRRVGTVDTVFEIVETIRRLEGPRLTELAEEVDRAPSTVHDYLKTLESKQYIVCNDRRYYLGLKFLDLGMYAKERLPIYEAARQTLQEVSDETGETAWLVIEEHGRAVTFHKAMNERGVQTLERIGMRSALHCHASGKVILSRMPDQKVTAIIDRYGLEEVTEYTTTDWDVLFEELERARSRGYATDTNEAIVGVSSVAAPVVVDGVVHGSIAVAGPTNRIQTADKMEWLAQIVKGGANTVELELTY